MQKTQVNALPSRSRGFVTRLPSRWTVLTALIAALVLAPIAAVIWIALHPTEPIWAHLISTALPRYLRNTVSLMVGVGVLSALIGTGTAWLVARYSFPGRRPLEYLLLLPLALPAYIGAYALVDFLEYAGPVQTALRGAFGWTSARDYWFPQVRSLGGALIVLTFALYPYVYLLARAAFREQSGAAEEVAQALGTGAWGRFLRIGLPLARPAIAAGAAIAMMETVSDFGTVEYFAVQTLTTGIFTTWLEAGNAGGAAQISMTVLGIVVLLVLLEKLSRRRLRYFNPTRQSRPPRRVVLAGWRAILAAALCTLPILVGFVLPVAVIAGHALRNAELWADPRLVLALWHTVSIGGIAALLTVTLALLIVYGVRLSGARAARLLLPMTTVGYAAPGAVLGIGILIPLAALDHRLADALTVLTGTDPGLLLTGSAFALVLAYSVRFFAIAQGAADSAMERVAPNLPLAARSLGRRRGEVLWEIYRPLMSGSLAAALLLVFVDSVKELPATLLLRPFNYETLATRVYDNASLENLGEASPAALLVVLVGLCAVALLARTAREN